MLDQDALKVQIMAEAMAHTITPTSGRFSKFLKAFSPFVPIALGIALKLSILDDVPTEASQRTAFLTDEYGRSLWLELLVSAYLLPITAFLTGTTGKRLAVLYITPAVFFVVCIFLVRGLPKFGIESNAWQIWVPDILSVLCVLVLGLLMVTTPQAGSAHGQTTARRR